MDKLLNFLNGLSLDSPFISVCVSVSRYLLAVLALHILYRCVRSMLRERYEPEVWAYFLFPDGRRAPVRSWENTVGRSRFSDVVIPEPTVSRSHAALIRGGDGLWTLYDLGSRGGVAVNGEAVARSAPLRDGDSLSLAGQQLQFLALTVQERGDVSRRRRTPGRTFRPAATFLELSLFFLLLTLSLCAAAPERAVDTALAFFAFLLGMWFYYLVMRSIRKSGFETEVIAFFLSGLGLCVCAGSAPENLFKQLILTFCGIGLFVGLGFWLRNIQRVKKFRWVAAGFALLLLGLNVLLAQSVFGARNWISIGGFSFQPSEFVKVAFVYAGAATLDRLFMGRNLFLFIGFSAVCVGAMALIGDFGTALIFFCSFLVIAFLRSGNLATVILAVSAAALAGFLVLSMRPHIAQRFATWGHVWSDPYGAGWQQTRALSAAASGGLFGAGAGMGWLKGTFAADSDMAFALLCEELGLIVALCAALAIVALALFTVKNAAQGRSSLTVIAACAAVSMLMAQLGLNVFGSLDILPFTGVTFPFVSQGGSSLISCWALLAFVKAVDTRKGASFAVSGAERLGRAEETVGQPVEVPPDLPDLYDPFAPFGENPETGELPPGDDSEEPR